MEIVTLGIPEKGSQLKKKANVKTNGTFSNDRLISKIGGYAVRVDAFFVV
jgi:hypothetical protein